MVEQLAVKEVNKTVDKRRYIDRRIYLIEAVRKRRKKIRLKSIEYLGSKCKYCGYDKCTDALEFHHLNNSKKDFGISSKGYTRSWDRVKQELDKCILLCANCHREVHSKTQRPDESRDVKSGEFREVLSVIQG